MTADRDLRLARYFGMSEGFFLGLQADYDLMERKRQIATELEAISTARRVIWGVKSTAAMWTSHSSVR